MTISTKPRHWVVLALAVIVLIVAIISFADFSGEPEPKWRRVFMMIGPGLMVAGIALNMVLDRKQGGSGD